MPRALELVGGLYAELDSFIGRSREAAMRAEDGVPPPLARFVSAALERQCWPMRALSSRPLAKRQPYALQRAALVLLSWSNRQGAALLHHDPAFNPRNFFTEVAECLAARKPRPGEGRLACTTQRVDTNRSQ
ncbi:hypothetical protein KFE25_003941 [Diacronema lutheri]|uniref:Uncharacterized protein n=1 Tax=Diacronema lutheri TaxID=2081491 RepID=A0A8J5XBS1_DIALT|nr:hypothetical protein KFE25_003941 [Diacronema lutheri]